MRLTDRPYYILRAPRVWWYVEGRRRFSRISPTIKASWRVGRYGRRALESEAGK